ncbi:MAG: hypothetical protein ACJ78Q_12210, partial [Chloroflexia bacterium]
MVANVDYARRIGAGGYFAIHRVSDPEGVGSPPPVQPDLQAQVEGEGERDGHRLFDPERLKRAVPADLRELRQWVVWRYEEKDGRPTKIPYQLLTSERRKASSTDSSTWGSFGSAIAVCELEKYDGLGFVLSADDPYVGIDLDHCRDASTGEIEE